MIWGGIKKALVRKFFLPCLFSAGQMLAREIAKGACRFFGRFFRGKNKMSLIQKIYHYADMYGVPRALALAVIKQESDFHVMARRYEPKYENYSRGLMQLMPMTARGMGFDGEDNALFDPDINLNYGMRYLAWQLKRYKGDREKAIAAYNAGSARKRNGKFINQEHVDRVMKYYYRFKTGELSAPILSALLIGAGIYFLLGNGG